MLIARLVHEVETPWQCLSAKTYQSSLPFGINQEIGNKTLKKLTKIKQFYTRNHPTHIETSHTIFRSD